MKTSVLIVDDEKLVRWSLRQRLEGAGYEVVEADTCEKAREVFSEKLPDLVTLDVRLPDGSGFKLLLDFKKISPRTPILMITAYGAIDDAVKALKIGAYDYLEKPINFERLLNSLKNAAEARDLRQKVDRLHRTEKSNYSVDRIVGESKVIEEAKQLVLKVACSGASTILIQGESGTGKDLVAKALHYESSRGNSSFMVINCAAIPEQLLETELFGHEKGAFTDARASKKGLFELADGGSIFFDEISEMPLNLQPKVLRVLEEQSFRRIGGIKDIRVDVRIICASNQELEKLVHEERFRQDLYYRLSVIPIELPPLRQRREDIPPLVQHFVDLYNEQFKKCVPGVTDRAMKILMAHSWPGNVRELKNAIERAMILGNGGRLDADAFRMGPGTGDTPLSLVQQLSALPDGDFDFYEFEKHLIVEALKLADWNQTQAARLLSISRDTLRYKVKKYKL